MYDWKLPSCLHLACYFHSCTLNLGIPFKDAILHKHPEPFFSVLCRALLESCVPKTID
uniref:Uncharacterized protein n=1 Tax=Rhizophora mucronata TaxID=61149 RepID=A0A2P2QCF8_RHIMU